MKRIISLMLTAALLASVLTGCSGDGKTLYTALFEKQYLQNKASLSVSFKISSEGFKEKEYNITNELSELKFDIDVLGKLSEDYKKIQANGKIKGTGGNEDSGYYSSINAWLDMDLTDLENPKLISTLKNNDFYPLFYFMPYIYDQNTKYVQYDLFKMLEKSYEFSYFDKSQMQKLLDLKAQKEIMQKALSIISVPIQSKSIQDGKKEFKIKLSDKDTMKMFNETIKALAKSEYLDEFIEPAIKKSLYTKEEAIAQIDMFLSGLDKISYIGKDGSEFNFVIDKSGYLESWNSTIDFRFSTKEMSAFINTFNKNAFNLNYVPDAFINVRMDLTSNTKEEKDAQIEYPDKEKTIDYLKVLDDRENKYKEQPYKYDPLANVDKTRAGYTLYKYQNPVELPSPGILVINDVKMVPIRNLSYEFGFATTVYDDESLNVWVSNYNKAIKIKIGSSTAYINGEAKECSAPALFIGDSVYVPLDLLTENSNFKVNWYQTEGGWAGIIELKN